MTSWGGQRSLVSSDRRCYFHGYLSSPATYAPLTNNEFDGENTLSLPLYFVTEGNAQVHDINLSMNKGGHHNDTVMCRLTSISKIQN